MNGGIGDSSYANNSLLQQNVILMTKPITEEAITKLYTSLTNPKTISIADLGCSSGPNTLLAVSNLVKAVDNHRKKLRRRHSPEFQIYLNDLPTNDFNTIFQSLPKHEEDLRRELGDGFGPCFFNGVPGSFYGRLFPTDSLHFVHSSYSLHWLSQVPKGIEENKRNIRMATTSPLSVIKAYYDQFEQDFSNFLECRSKELVKRGRMVLTMQGRSSENPTCHLWELLTLALNEIVAEGFVEEEKLNSFNVPLYTPSLAEVKFIVEKEGSFTIDCLEASQIYWTGYNGTDDYEVNNGYGVARSLRAVIEPMLVSHFGEGIIDELFHSYTKMIVDSISTRPEITQFTNRNVIHMTKPITEQAMRSLYSSLDNPKTISIADLGCSSGPNTFLAISNLVKAVDDHRKKLRRPHSPEFQIYLNDLPTNDFNTIFQSLPKHEEDLRREIGEGCRLCFFNGVPGSFYGRLFPINSLHFVHSSNSLNWLSQVPKGIKENKGNIICVATASPPNVIKAYYDQFESDFSTFIKCRSKELVNGGRMVLTMQGIKSENPTFYIWELLALSINDLVLEGLVEEDKLNSFNFPLYLPTLAEIKFLVEKDGSFTIDRLEASQIHWTGIGIDDNDDNTTISDEDINGAGNNVAMFIRAGLEPVLVSHFGEGIIDELFHRYSKKIAHSMSTYQEKAKFTSVTVSMTKI
nr:salicylate carboxymethyltransferase-like [Ipomoea batatas]